VRGGYLLLHQKFSVRGNIQYIGSFQLPLTEGVVNRNYSIVAVRLLRHALKQYSMLFCLGIGSLQEPLTRLLGAMGWKIDHVPFYFRVVNSSRFLANISYVRTNPRKRFLLDILRFTGLGWAGMKAVQFRVPARCIAAANEVNDFGPWADSVWQECHQPYSLVALRDSETLNSLYHEPRFLRLRISRHNRTVGWAVMLDTQMSRHKYFGNMRVGSIVDCLSLPEDAPCVIRCAMNFLECRHVDLIVTNQAHSAWCDALSLHGFVKGPSNFLLAVSQDLLKRLQPFEAVKRAIHMNRGDGDGPINL
jgi:hypothetical protein